MNAYILPSVLGLGMGLLLHWAGFTRPGGLQDALALRCRHTPRTALYALGAGMALTALLCWLAVIDVDGIAVLPLSAGALAGGVLFGVAAAISGYTPLTAFSGLGGGPFLTALCVLAGGTAGTLLLGVLEAPLTALRALPPLSDTTLFRVTLDEGYLLGGGFLGQGCAGLLLMAIAVCIPSNRRRREPAALLPPEPAEDFPAPPEPAELLLLPAPEETFIALLPGEEALVVDTALDELPPAEEEEPDEAETDKEEHP